MHEHTSLRICEDIQVHTDSLHHMVHPDSVDSNQPSEVNRKMPAHSCQYDRAQRVTSMDVQWLVSSQLYTVTSSLPQVYTHESLSQLTVFT